MQAFDWLWILHPALAVVLVYPLLGVVLRLAAQTRQRRVNQLKLPPTVGRDHTQVGKWLTAAVVAVVLMALTVIITTKAGWAVLAAEPVRPASLAAVLAATVVSLVALWRIQPRVLRILFAVLTWAGVLALGAQPEVWRVSDDPRTFAFWSSHYWTGVGLVGLLLFSMALRPEILRRLAWRRLHIAANSLAALLFLVQGISGPKDLLEIPLNWQKPAIYQCDFASRTCPAQQ